MHARRKRPQRLKPNLSLGDSGTSRTRALPDFESSRLRRKVRRARARNPPRASKRQSEDALDALQRDHAFLLKGDVFTEEVLRSYVDYKRSKEVDAIRLRPHPYEFALYYDI